MLFNYYSGRLLSKHNASPVFLSKKTILIISLIINLSALGYFKYLDFLIENINKASSSNFDLLNLSLPLAISFFTFQQVAYLVDSYKNKTKEYNILDYAVFVTFFPQLIAGPIVHHSEMMPQFANIKNKLINYKNITMGLFIFSIGLFKKIVIADTFATWATAGFDQATTLNLIEAWITSLSYTFQLYFDFSGYTDMAIGLALLFNIRLPINFNSPYKSRNIQDFWQRWHITLSRFLRDYVYIPLGGNRKGKFKTYNNLMATFIIGGIWHGAGWTFIFWGFLHGSALIIQRLWSNLGYKIWTWLAWFITFNFINIAWVFFRAKEWDDAMKVLKGMLGYTGISLPASLGNRLSFLTEYSVTFGAWLNHIQGSNVTIIWILSGFLITISLKNSTIMLKNFQLNTYTLVLSSVAFLLSVLSLHQNTEFLYFNF